MMVNFLNNMMNITKYQKIIYKMDLNIFSDSYCCENIIYYIFYCNVSNESYSEYIFHKIMANRFYI